MDLGLLLDDLLMDYVRVAGIFFVAGIALFNFTNMGKMFSIFSLLIAFVLVVAAVIDYYVERNRIAKLGYSPRKLIDVLAVVMIGIAFLIIWVMFQVLHTEQTSLSIIVKEIEHEVDVTNEKLIANIRELDERIIATNRELINVIKGLPVKDDKMLTKPLGSLSKPLIYSSGIGEKTSKYFPILKSINTQDNMAKIASLAAVS